jgi:AcrR family transcriptional regulator
MRKPGSNGPDTMRKLRSAAIRLLSTCGYQGMNLRMLASTLGMHAGSLYNYIDSKQDLLYWLMKEATEKLLERFEQEIEKVADPEEQIREFVAFHLRYHIINRKESAVLATEMRSLTPRNRHAIAHLQRLYTDKIHEIVRRGHAAGLFRIDDPQIAAFGIVQMLTGITRWYNPRGRLSVDELIAIYTDMTLGILNVNVASRVRTPAIRSNGNADGGIAIGAVA